MAKKNRNRSKKRKHLKKQRARLRSARAMQSHQSFEQLESRILLAADFGDAPSPFPVTISEDGARHTVGTLRLGSATVDMESNGTHSVQANFDDLNGSSLDDEDGVTFGTLQVGALDATVTVNVQGAAGKLDAWIDFNGDGNWGGSNERIFVSRDVVVGGNHLTFDVPATAIDGQTFARFRLSTAGNLATTGLAANGEVEDHAVTIVSPILTNGSFGERNVVFSSIVRPTSVTAIDMDDDGDMDMVFSSDGRIGWLENDGSESFTSHEIALGIDNANDVSVVDVDGDGDIDVISSASTFSDGRIDWYENDGSQNFTLHAIPTNADGPLSVFAADVDGDGDMDFVGASWRDDMIAWYENDGNQNFTTHIVTTQADVARSVFAIDVDSDGDMDILSASSDDDAIAWYENDGSQNFTAHTIGTNGDSPVSVFAADIDDDGDIDVLSASNTDYEIAWYENDGNQNFTTHVIATSAIGAQVVTAADVDGDGDLDVLSGSSRTHNGQIEWYENDGSQNFTTQRITTVLHEIRDVVAADLDGDGDLDVLSVSHDDHDVEWFENLALDRDFGDAPLPYPTTLAEDGARHDRIKEQGPTLGLTRDSEYDTSHSPNADGDGAEDGVSFGTIQVGALDAVVTVIVNGDDGKLDAWIDFNGDGSWSGPGEQIFASRDVEEGVNFLKFDVPSSAIEGQTFARFRISTDGNLGVVGLADDGEVEDHVLSIESPAVASGVFSTVDIHTTTTGAQSVMAIDVDGDGDMDVLSASVGDNRVSWFENDGNDNFTFHAINSDADGAVKVIATDIDGDGDIDVVSASRYDNKIAWYENDGSQSFTAHTISTDADNAWSVFAADADGDGDIDLFSASFDDDKIAWYENDGNQNFTAHTISTAADGARSVVAADVDNDGDLDVLSASFFDSKIAWYENDGDQNFSAHTISTSANGAVDVFATDVDGDGDLDVLSASNADDKIAWYENNGSQNFTAHTITTNADSVRTVYAADMDGDGDMDVLSASFSDDKVAWYRNDGSENFSTQIINTDVQNPLSLFPADIDGDGDLDVVSSSFFATPQIVWHTNQDIDRDFGDAPSPYPTTVAENGARHDPVGPTLGASRDAEPDGTNSSNANSDGSDENGVTFGTIQIGSSGATVTVNVQGAAGKLDAWIDFNNDGSWGGPEEQILASSDVAVGSNTLSFNVPSSALDGQTFARFRLSTLGSLGPNGIATDGEVEDHPVTIVAPTVRGGSFSSEIEISSGVDQLEVADIDGDGDVDMIGASAVNDTIFWFENDGSENFTSHAIPSPEGPISLVATDLDSDGDVDILGIFYDSSVFFDRSDVVWYENDGNQNFTFHTISMEAFEGVPSRVSVADVDGDGDVDILGSSSENEEVAWYENDGSQNFVRHAIGFVDSARAAIGADIDGDGDIDVLSGSYGRYIDWFENDGNQNFTRRQVADSAWSTRDVFASDIDGDGDMDVLSAGGNRDEIAWYENNGNDSFTEHLIATDAETAQSVFAADVDGDGDIDVLTTSSTDQTVAWYTNDGNQNFTRYKISTTADTPLRAVPADVDNDGDLDVVIASAFDDTIGWFENRDIDQDFGDSPSPYPTLLTDDGARHYGKGPTLGATRDNETNGTHSSTANGDGTDEDGVVFGTIRVGALAATVTINVQGAAAKLDAWIDFNGDGNWGGAGEQIFSSEAVDVGDNLLTFDVPSSAVAGQLHARFRLSFQGGLGVAGLAEGGEVEDYVVTVLPPLEAKAIFDDKFSVSTSADGAQGVYAADVDGDGDMDLLSASLNDDKIAWYENDGYENFTEHSISTDADEAVDVRAADVDGDGDLDVLSASRNDDTIAWYENNGEQGFVERIITTQADGAENVFTADVDGDGDLDVLSASRFDDTIAWYENDGNENFSSHVISSQADQARSVFAADVDSDGDLDVLSASFLDDTVAWYENDGNQNFTARIITSQANGATSVFSADLDADGDMDVLSASYNDDKIAWYENNGNQNFTTRVISTQANGASSVLAIDFDGDGDLDVLSASAVDDTIKVYRNDGNQNFSVQTVTTDTDGVSSVFAADVDGDGDTEVISAVNNDSEIAWYRNTDIDRDFGDAPYPYPTTRDQDGARHTSIGPTIGSSRDVEASGVHSNNANSDGADEDGVTFGTIQIGALGATATVNVQGGGGYLDAWIDFNGDGVWGGPGEHIVDSQSVVTGDNIFSFDVPIYANGGETYARFRLSSQGNHSPAGLALDGEVEDYAVSILPPAVATGDFGSPIEVSVTADSARSVFAADIDGDGDMDILSASSEDDKIAWYENDGNQNYTDHFISSDDAASRVFAADLDGDGDMDVLSTSALDDKVSWHENDGNQNFTSHTVANFINAAANLFVVDVDGDGDLDVLSSEPQESFIYWFENDGNQEFTTHRVSSFYDRGSDLFAADVDSDGDIDLLTSSGVDDRIAWYENDGDENFTLHVITRDADNARGVFATDVDGDGDIDVLSASWSDNKIAWYENDGSQNFTTHVISTSAINAEKLFAADVDGDGDMDVISASFGDDTIAWYRNDGNQNFTEHVISTIADGARNLFVADVDGDGDLDVLSASSNDDKIAWYPQNQLPVFSSPAEVSIGDGTQPVIELVAEDGDLPVQTIAYSIDGTADDNDKFEIINGNQLQFKVAPDFNNPDDVGGTAGDNIYHVTVLADDGSGGEVSRTIFVSVVNAPTIDSITINSGQSQRSTVNHLVLTFDGSVDIDPDAFSVIQRSDGNSNPTGIAVASSFTCTKNGNTVVTLTFENQTRNGSGALADGNYQLTVDGSKVRLSGTELTLGADYVYGDSFDEPFFALYGDWNGDRTVNIFDLLAFRKTYLAAVGDANFSASLDHNADGFINVIDLLFFRKNYGSSLIFV